MVRNGTFVITATRSHLRMSMDKVRQRFTEHRDVVSFVALLSLAVVAFSINAVRIDDNNFWSDECFSINLLKNDLWDIWYAAAGDTHPPLFYYIGFVITRVFGFNSMSFHLISLSGLFVILVVSLTWIRSRFGNVPAVVMIVLSSILSTSLVYVIEVRMYEWCAVFVLLTFMMLYESMEKPDRLNLALTVLFGVAAAYTHVYGLLTVASMYVCLLLVSLTGRGYNPVTVAKMIVVSVLLYIPWVWSIISAIGRTSDFWITGNPEVSEILEYLFDTGNTVLSLALSVVTIVAAMLVLVHATGRGRRLTGAVVEGCESTKGLWIAVCALTVILTVAGAMIVSEIIRPYLVLRYLYPLCVIVWLVLGVCIGSMRYGNVMAAVITALLLAVCVPYYVDMRGDEKETDAMISDTLEATTSVDGDDRTLSPMVWVMDYYYPDSVNLEYNSEELREMDTGSGATYWLFLFGPVSDDTADELEGMGLTAAFHYHGNLGSHDTWIYRIMES